MYNITCRTLSIDQNRIVKVGLIDTSSGLKHSATPKELNSLLRNGDKCYFTRENKQTAEVKPYGSDYITTDGDASLDNNLRSLSSC